MKTLRASRLVVAVTFACAGVLGASAETLTALGRVLPRSGIVDLGGTPGDTVQQIRVKEGDWVEPGQPLARLSSADAAGQRVAQAQADLEATRASTARDRELAHQQVTFAETEARFAQERYDRIAAARNSEFISPDQLSDREVARNNATLKLERARQDEARAGRDADRTVRAAEADLAAARAALAAAEVQSPIKARVLKIPARPGAQAGRGPLFRLGDTSTMIVVVEVYEADVLKVKAGQKATVSSAALPKKMTGVVESVSSLINRNSVESLDPNDTGQSRIVEVTLKMDENSPLDRLVLLQVDVVIDL